MNIFNPLIIITNYAWLNVDEILLWVFNLYAIVNFQVLFEEFDLSN